MLRPMEFWVGNARTVWVDLLIRNSWDFSVANEALSLYQDHERTSKMDYQIWSDILPVAGRESNKVRSHWSNRSSAPESRHGRVDVHVGRRDRFGIVLNEQTSTESSWNLDRLTKRCSRQAARNGDRNLQQFVSRGLRLNVEPDCQYCGETGSHDLGI